MKQKLFSCVAIYIVIYGIIIQAIKFIITNYIAELEALKLKLTLNQKSVY